MNLPAIITLVLALAILVIVLVFVFKNIDFGRKKLSNVEFKRSSNKVSFEKVSPYVYVLLPILGYVIFTIFPLIVSFIIQFTDMTDFDLSSIQWNNFQNFKDVFSDADFWLSIGVSFMLCVSQFISLFVALVVSILLSKKPWGHKVFQVIFFIPYICSSVAVALMWKWMFDENYGIINDILVKLGTQGIQWYHSKGAYPWMIIIATVWQAPGYGIVMYKAALTSVNPSLYEAADIDGANAWKKLTKVTLPQIAPTTFFLLMAGIINGLQIFDLAKLFGQGNWQGYVGPDNIGLTTVLYIYNTGTINNHMPRAAVMSWFLFLVIFVVSVINFRLRRKWVDE